MMSFSLAPWRPILARALHRNRSKPHSRYLQLATVNVKGQPSNRTVVFRGFLEKTNQLQIVTDTRSSKIKDIQHQPWCEICWYFSQTREQFRLSGNITLVNQETEDKRLQEARHTLWGKLSTEAKQQFNWPSPGQPIEPIEENFCKQLSFIESPVSNFCLLLLEPEQVDHLELRGKPHHRQIYYWNEQKNWITQSVNP